MSIITHDKKVTWLVLMHEYMVMEYFLLLLKRLSKERKSQIFADLQMLFASMDQEERKRRMDKMVFLDPLTNRCICRICNTSVSRKTLAIDHIEGVHIRILSYPCQYCDSYFTCSSLRRTHVHTNHREQNKLAKYLTDKDTGNKIQYNTTE